MGMGNVVKFDGNFSFLFCLWENSSHKGIQQKCDENMNKFSNKRQIHILFAKMQRNPDMAKGRSRENKEKFDVFWGQLSTELNCAGPPIKSMYEWKKVWIDQKRYVKKKAASAMAAMQVAGGSSGEERPFSTTTETILNMAGIEQSIRAGMRAAMKVSEQVLALEAVGIKQSQLVMAHAAADMRPEIANPEHTHALLLSSTESKINAADMLTPYSIVVKEEPRLSAHADEEPQPSSERAGCVSELLIPKIEKDECVSEILNEECTLRDQSANHNTKDNDSTDSIGAVWEPETVVDHSSAKRPRVAVEIPVQKQIYQKINEALENANRHCRELKVGMKKIHQKLVRLEEQNELKLEELKRHNIEMEQLRRQEVECKIKKNARLLEIEELKLKIMEFRDRQQDLAY